MKKYTSLFTFRSSFFNLNTFRSSFLILHFSFFIFYLSAQTVGKSDDGSFYILMPDGSYNDYDAKNKEHKKLMSDYEKKLKTDKEKAITSEAKDDKSKKGNDKKVREKEIIIADAYKAIEKEKVFGKTADNAIRSRVKAEYDWKKLLFSSPEKKKTREAERLENWYKEQKDIEKNALSEFKKAVKESDRARKTLYKNGESVLQLSHYQLFEAEKIEFKPSAEEENIVIKEKKKEAEKKKKKETDELADEAKLTDAKKAKEKKKKEDNSDDKQEKEGKKIAEKQKEEAKKKLKEEEKKVADEAKIVDAKKKSDKNKKEDNDDEKQSKADKKLVEKQKEEAKKKLKEEEKFAAARKKKEKFEKDVDEANEEEKEKREQKTDKKKKTDVAKTEEKTPKKKQNESEPEVEKKALKLKPEDNVILNPPFPACEIAFNGVDEFTNIKRLETAKQDLFKHTDEIMLKYYEKNDFLTCQVSASRSDKGYKYLNFFFTFNSDNVQNTYGVLEKDQVVTLRFLDGETMPMFNSKTDRGFVDPMKKTTTYKAIVVVNANQEKKLFNGEIDQIRVLWGTGTDDYAIYDLDFFANILNCVK